MQLSQQQVSQLSWLNSTLTQLHESRLNQAYYGDLFLAVSKGNGQAMINLNDLCVSSAVIPFGNYCFRAMNFSKYIASFILL